MLYCYTRAECCRRALVKPELGRALIESGRPTWQPRAAGVVEQPEVCLSLQSPRCFGSRCDC